MGYNTLFYYVPLLSWVHLNILFILNSLLFPGGGVLLILKSLIKFTKVKGFYAVSVILKGPRIFYIERYNVWRPICLKNWNLPFNVVIWSELKELVLNAYFTVIYWTVCHYVVFSTWIRLQRAHWLIEVFERLRHSDNDVISSDGT